MFSTSPIRTTVSNWLPSASVHSESVAPSSLASFTAVVAISARVTLRRASDSHAVDADGRNTHAYGHGLSFLATNAHAFVQFQIVANHADELQGFRTIADQSRATHGPGDPAVFDQVTLGRVEYEVAAGDVDLAAAEV